MAIHKIAYFEENGYGCDADVKRAIANYEKSAAEGEFFWKCVGTLLLT